MRARWLWRRRTSQTSRCSARRCSATHEWSRSRLVTDAKGQTFTLGLRADPKTVASGQRAVLFGTLEPSMTGTRPEAPLVMSLSAAETIIEVSTGPAVEGAGPTDGWNVDADSHRSSVVAFAAKAGAGAGRVATVVRRAAARALTARQLAPQANVSACRAPPPPASPRLPARCPGRSARESRRPRPCSPAGRGPCSLPGARTHPRA
jgi:hypothetical protein